jgi:hypothetical protein
MPTWVIIVLSVFWISFTFLILWLLVKEAKAGKAKWESAAVKHVFKGAAAYVLMVAIVFGVPLMLRPYKNQILPTMVKVLGLYGTRLFICAVVLGLGVVVHWWKRKDQYTYGVGEFVFGVAVTVFITFSITPGQSVLSQWVGLGGAAYVIARGLSNRAEAREKADGTSASIDAGL